MRLRRLYPDPADTTVADAFAAPDLAGKVVANFVATTDGRVAIDGRAGPVGGDADREAFLRLRTRPDCVMAGAATLRAERYGHLVRDEELRAVRTAAGLEPEPLACVLTHSLDLPWDTALWTDPASRVALYTSSRADPPPTAAQVAVHRWAGAELTVDRVVRSLRADHGVGSILCEGGPTLVHQLLTAGLLDELFLTVEPKLVGADPRDTGVIGPPAVLPPARLALVSLHAHEAGTLFCRYRVEGSHDHAVRRGDRRE